MKTLLNSGLAAIAFLVFLPVMIPIAVLIAAVDGWPVFFLQERLGKKRQKFLVFKFRTMDAHGKITSIGRWLRATGLDELPQLLNIIRGEMHVVGPRPLTVSERFRLKYNTERHERRWSVPPGLTGLAQIEGGKDALHSWALDRLYLRNESVVLDAKIVTRTLVMNALGKRYSRRLLGTFLRQNRWRIGQGQPLPGHD